MGRDGCALVAFGRHLYVIGGSDGKRDLATVEIYDPGTNAWNSGPSMTSARRGCAAVVVDGLLYVVGGVARGIFVSTMEMLDPAAGAWIEMPSMPTCRAGCSAAAALIS